METVRDILAAHGLGISRPGLLAWARLRIDPAMTEAQLEEELARLGPEVVDIDGFLYLRATLDARRRGPGWGTARSTTTLAPREPASARRGRRRPASRPAEPAGPTDRVPPVVREGVSGLVKVGGLILALLWFAASCLGFFEA